MNLREIPSRNQRSVSSSLSRRFAQNGYDVTHIYCRRASNHALERSDRECRPYKPFSSSAKRKARLSTSLATRGHPREQPAGRPAELRSLSTLAADEGCDDTSFYGNLRVEEFRPVIRHHTICLQSHDILIGAEPYIKVPVAKYRSLMTISHLIVDLRVRVPLIFPSFQSPYVPNRIGMQYPYLLFRFLGVCYRY